VEHTGHVLDKEELMRAVWPDIAVEENNLNQNISILRRALGEGRAEHRYIATVPSRGYQFVAPVKSAAGPAAPEGPTEKASIAVLPFANVSTDAEYEYFGDGLADDLISALSKLDRLRVVARTSAFSFKGRHVDVRQIAERLGVNFVLEGSVRKSGTRLSDLGPEFADRLKFNLSHSAGLALVAIATASKVGVDLEHIREQSDSADIARRFFSAAEVDYLMALPSHLHAESFFSCWTKKEAYVKACGEGLTMPLNSFSVPLTTDPAHTPEDLHVASKDIVPARRWSLYTLRPAPGYAGALAIEGTGWRLRQWQWKMPHGVERAGEMRLRLSTVRA
jgi:phosphopantetheine--protein transferase-like protein